MDGPPPALLPVTETMALPAMIVGVMLWLVVEATWVFSRRRPPRRRRRRTRTPDEPGAPRVRLAILAGVLLAGLGVRLALAAIKGLNHLEFGYLVVPLTSLGVRDVVLHEVALQQGHFPLHHLLLYATSQLGTSLLTLRAPGALLSVLGVVGTYRLGRILGDRTVAMVAAGMFALSAAMVMYGADASCYSLEVVVAVWLLVALFRANGSGRSWWHLAVGVLAALLFWTSPFMLLYLAALATVMVVLCVLARRQHSELRKRLRLLRALARGSLLTMPGYALIFTTHHYSRAFLTSEQTLYWEMWHVLLFPLEWLRVSFGLFPIVAVAVVPVGLLMVCGIVELWRRDRKQAHLLLAFLAMPLLAEVAYVFLNQFRSGGYQPVVRHHLLVAPLLFVAVASGIRTRWRPKLADAALTVLVVAQVVGTCMLFAEQSHDPLAQAVELFEEGVQPGDTFAVLPAFYAGQTEYQLSGRSPSLMDYPRWRGDGREYFGPLDPATRWIDAEGVSWFCHRLVLAVIRERFMGRPYFAPTFADDQLATITADHGPAEVRVFPQGELHVFALNHATPRIGDEPLRLDLFGQHSVHYRSPFYRGPAAVYMQGLGGVHEFAVPTDRPGDPVRVKVGLRPRDDLCGLEPDLALVQGEQPVALRRVRRGTFVAHLEPPDDELLRFQVHVPDTIDPCWDLGEIEFVAFERAASPSPPQL